MDYIRGEQVISHGTCWMCQHQPTDVSLHWIFCPVCNIITKVPAIDRPMESKMARYYFGHGQPDSWDNVNDAVTVQVTREVLRQLRDLEGEQHERAVETCKEHADNGHTCPYALAYHQFIDEQAKQAIKDKAEELKRQEHETWTPTVEEENRLKFYRWMVQTGRLNNG